MTDAATRPTFLADAMLGDVARWLRILGEDCVYADPAWPDEEILVQAAPEDRVVVTRDAGLVRAARKRALRAIEVPQARTEDVLEAVYRSLSLRPDPERIATRCATCNGALVATDPAAARQAAGSLEEGRPPDAVFDRHEVFWTCTACGQLYWRGTHWDNIEAVRRRLDGRLSPR